MRNRETLTDSDFNSHKDDADDDDEAEAERRMQQQQQKKLTAERKKRARETNTFCAYTNTHARVFLVAVVFLSFFSWRAL